MEPEGKMSEGLLYNPHDKLNQSNSMYWHQFIKILIYSNIAPTIYANTFPRGHLPVGLIVKILKTLLPSSILATFRAHINLTYLIIRNILCKGYKL